MARVRLKCFWGAVDLELTDEQVYDPAEVKSLGVDVEAPGGIGVRRAQLVFSRANLGVGEGPVVTTIDFLNTTGGEPDDTWITADFTNLETLITTWWTGIDDYAPNNVVFDQIRWYRVGKGAGTPNPPVRITEMNHVGASNNVNLAQMAITLTEKTAVRKAWGRMYLPLNNYGSFDADGFISATVTAAIANVSEDLFSAAAAADYIPVVWSRTRNKLFSVEYLQVDNIADVMRSRRPSTPTLREVRTVDDGS
jgi:hypothetical protein